MNFFKHRDPDFYDEPSFLDVESIVQLKRKKRAYNFDQLPVTAILVQNKKIVQAFSSPFRKKLKGFPGTGYTLSPSILLCAMDGSGAPGALVLLEELRILGVKKIIFVGTAGILDAAVKEQQVSLITQAYSAVGSSVFYSNENILQPKRTNWFEKISELADLPDCISWSTDCPYRETSKLLDSYKKKGVQLVDMESAAIYAFCAFHGLDAACILIAADSLTQTIWQPPKSPVLLFKKQKELISQMSTLISQT